MQERIDPVGGVKRSGSERSGYLPWESIAAAVKTRATSASEEQNRAVSLEEVVELLNKELGDRGKTLRFELRKESGQLQAQIVDTETGDVVRKMPPDYLYRIRNSISVGVGIIVNDEAD
jgi:uncharacterized FlaG/YvyC family protein